MEFDRDIGRDIAQLEHRAQGGLVLIGEDFTASFSVIDGDRPEQLVGNGLRYRERVRVGTIQKGTGRVTGVQPVEGTGPC